jgi:hypothetical protein
MNIIPIRNVWFDDAATLVMGEAFDQACKSLRSFGSAIAVTRSSQSGLLQLPKMASGAPARLCQQALIPFGIEDMSMLVVSVGPKPRVPAYASVTHPA